AAEEDDTARSIDDGLINHETLFGKGREAQRLARFDDAAPGDLQDHPNGHLAFGDFHHAPSVIANHADLFVGFERVRAGRVANRVNVSAGNVCRRSVWTQTPN